MRRTLIAAAGAAFLVTAAPSLAASTPTFNGTVGPGFTISMAKKPTKAGKIKLVVADKSSIHNFHLTGPGVNRRITTVDFTGTKSRTFRLKKGTYRYVCDPHSDSMHGSFKVR